MQPKSASMFIRRYIIRAIVVVVVGYAVFSQCSAFLPGGGSGSNTRTGSDTVRDDAPPTATPSPAERALADARTAAQFGTPAEAIAAYTTALERDPSLAAAYFERGALYAQQGDYTRALDDYGDGLERDDGYEGYIRRGVLHRTMGDYDAALRDFERAAERGGVLRANSPLYAERGYTHYLRGDYDAARQDLDNALRNNERDGWALAYRGLVSIAEDDYDAALRDYDAAVAVSGTHTAFAYLQRGSAYHDIDQFEQALADFDAALTEAPASSPVYFARAATHQMLGDTPAAITDYEQFLTLTAGATVPPAIVEQRTVAQEQLATLRGNE